MNPIGEKATSYHELAMHMHHNVVIESQYFGNVEEGYCDTNVYLKCKDCETIILSINNPNMLCYIEKLNREISIERRKRLDKCALENEEEEKENARLNWRRKLDIIYEEKMKKILFSKVRTI